MSRLRQFMFCAVVLLLAGCGPRLVRISGKVVVNGAPVPPDKKLEVTLRPEGGPADLFPAMVNSDGQFTVGGKSGKGIPPGTYRILIEGIPGARKQGPIVREFTKDEEITIDVGQPGNDAAGRP